jgi:hypothetical protein
MKVQDIQQAYQVCPYFTAHSILQAVVMLRVVRFVDHPMFQQHNFLIWRAMRESLNNIPIALCFGLYVWVFAACAFSWCETLADGKAQRELSSIPNALYWTSIFLVGEWSIVDFSTSGSRLCIFFCIFGKMVCAIPLGIVQEALLTTMLKVDQERAKTQDLAAANQRLELVLLGNRNPDTAPSALRRQVGFRLSVSSVASHTSSVKGGKDDEQDDENNEVPIDKYVSEATGSFSIGEKVERRDADGEEWGIGYVVKLDPLEVTMQDDTRAHGFKFEQVRKLPQAKEKKTVTTAKGDENIDL